MNRIFTFAFAVCAFIALLVLGAGESLARPAVTGVRAGDHHVKTRFVLDLTDRVNFSVGTLADPYRIVLDLPEVEWKLSPEPLGQPKGLIEKVRFGAFSNNTARLVIDVRQAVTITKSFLIEPRDGQGWRLVLDIEAVESKDFVATLKAAPPASPPAVKEKNPPSVTKNPQTSVKPHKPTVVIDPGHGGVDPGTIGVSGVYEKTITLAAGLELRNKLKASGRYNVFMTRESDYFIPLRERMAKARAANADLFISLHADALPNPKIQGLSIYTLSTNASDSEAAALADRENKADLIAGIDLSHESQEVVSILIDLAQRETMNLSAEFATDTVTELARNMKLLNNTHRFAGFAVLKAPDVPSVLVEMGYLSNKNEEKLLRQPEYRAKLINSLSRAVDAYFAKHKAVGGK
jgi:N-acetylmuramoyl-L-alanine amidase